MRHSERFGAAAKAMLAVQKELPTISADAFNPDTKSKYATLAGLVETIRPILTKHGFSVLQSEPEEIVAGYVLVDTTLLHESGEWFRGRSRVALLGRMKSKNDGGGRHEPDAQASGSAVSYARRYGLMAILGLASQDDDGAAARARTTRQERIERRREEAKGVQGQDGRILDPDIMPVGGRDQRGKPIAEMSLAVLRQAIVFCRTNSMQAERLICAREIMRRANSGKSPAQEKAEAMLRALTQADDTLADQLAEVADASEENKKATR